MRSTGDDGVTGSSTWRTAWTVTRLLVSLVVVSVLLGVVGSGLLLPVAATAGSALALSNDLLDELPADLPSSALPQTSVMLSADGTPIAFLYDENRTSVSLDQMSIFMQEAIVAVEDSRFYEHGALDAKGVARALVSNSTGGTTEGASTLTQQYVKNLLVETAVAAGDRKAAEAAIERTPARKLREAKMAMAAEEKLSKPEILERYLNIVYFGGGAYGVEAAAQRYFGVPARSMTLPQAALLAGLVQDPTQFDPVAHPVAATKRRNVVLALMRDQEMITPARYAAARATKVKISGSVPANGCVASPVAGWFCEYVVQSLLKDQHYSGLGITPQDRTKALQRGGLEIRTTLDLKAQEAASRAVSEKIPATDRSGLGTAAVTVEPGTGAVVAMTQNRAYAVDGRRGTTSVNYAVDQALGGSHGFQTGSSFKAFTLAAWLQAGHSLDDTVDATQRAFDFSDFTRCGDALRGTQPYEPANSEGTETGEMSVQQATSNSVNVAFVDMETRLDLCDIARTATRLGVHLASPQKECSTKVSTAVPDCLPSLTLGVKEISPLTMAAAYAGFASGGTWCAPMPVTSLTQRTEGGDRSIVGSYRPECSSALPADVASTVNRALTHVLTDGTASTVGQPGDWPAAGKTGTTDGPYDTWFVGYTAQRSTAVWVGDPGATSDGTFHRRRLTDIAVAGQSYPVVFGASLAAPIWKQVTAGATHGLPPEPLP